MEIKKIRKNEIPPNEGLASELHLINDSLGFRIPRVDANFKNNPFIMKERMNVLKKYEM